MPTPGQTNNNSSASLDASARCLRHAPEGAMNRTVTATLVTAAATAASWWVRHRLDRRAARRLRGPCRQVETWKNEDGAIESQHSRIDSTQVPR
jgi:hypothetical protein